MNYLEYAKHIGADEFLLKWVETTLKEDTWYRLENGKFVEIKE